jgi:hypothetical protein
MRKHFISGLALLFGLSAPLAFAATGEYWEITNKMEMEGMSMPGMTSKVCMPKGGEKDPRNSADKDCEMTDMKVSGNKSSWKMRCNKDGETMTGSGEMATSADRTEGTIHMTTKQGSMAMSFVNKKLGGTCDPDELKKKMEAQVAASNKELAKMCEGMNTSHDWLVKSSLFLEKNAICAAKKDQFCDLMKRDAGRDVEVYFSIKNPAPPVSKSCGINMDSAKKALCKSVDANNSDFTKQFRGDLRQLHVERLRAECPAEMKTYAEVSRKRFCEGRGFTEQKRVSLADCLKGVSGDDEAMNTPDPDEPAAGGSAGVAKTKSTAAQQSKTEPAKSEPSKGSKLLDGINLPSMPGGASTDAVIDGAKKLKNLFGL